MSHRCCLTPAETSAGFIQRERFPLSKVTFWEYSIFFKCVWVWDVSYTLYIVHRVLYHTCFDMRNESENVAIKIINSIFPAQAWLWPVLAITMAAVSSAALLVCARRYNCWSLRCWSPGPRWVLRYQTGSCGPKLLLLWRRSQHHQGKPRAEKNSQ